MTVKQKTSFNLSQEAILALEDVRLAIMRTRGIRVSKGDILETLILTYTVDADALVERIIERAQQNRRESA